MNAITFNTNIFLIGKFGKFIIAIVGILTMQKSTKQLKDFIQNNMFLFLFWVLCVLFTMLRVSHKGFDLELVQHNVLFLLFIYFFYLLYNLYQKKHIFPDYYIFKFLAKIININFFFWTAIALLLSLNIWHTLEDRTGLGLFYNSYIQFGIFACFGGIVNFTIVKYRTLKKSKIHFAMFLLYSVLVILSNSRNAQVMLLVFLFLNFFPFFKKTAIKHTYILITLSVAGLVFLFSNGFLLDETFTEITTGRNRIWYYVFEHYSQVSIFSGEGIFGLNNTILENNLYLNYYFQRLDFLYFHSSFMEVFAATGLIGLVLFCLFIFEKIKEKKKLYQVNILVSVLAGSVFESFLIQPTILISFLFWFLIAGSNKNIVKKEI